MAIERSDVCVIMIDAEAGVTEQDTKVAGLAHEAGKACILAVNKWDAIEKNDKTMQEFRKNLIQTLHLCLMLLRYLFLQRQVSVLTGCLNLL